MNKACVSVDVILEDSIRGNKSGFLISENVRIPADVTSLARCTNTIIQDRATVEADNATPDSSKDRLPRDDGGDDDVCDP